MVFGIAALLVAALQHTNPDQIWWFKMESSDPFAPVMAAPILPMMRGIPPNSLKSMSGRLDVGGGLGSIATGASPGTLSLRSMGHTSFVQLYGAQIRGNTRGFELSFHMISPSMRHDGTIEGEITIAELYGSEQQRGIFFLRRFSPSSTRTRNCFALFDRDDCSGTDDLNCTEHRFEVCSSLPNSPNKFKNILIFYLDGVIGILSDLLPTLVLSQVHDCNTAVRMSICRVSNHSDETESPWEASWGPVKPWSPVRFTLGRSSEPVDRELFRLSDIKLRIVSSDAPALGEDANKNLVFLNALHSIRWRLVGGLCATQLLSAALGPEQLWNMRDHPDIFGYGTTGCIQGGVSGMEFPISRSPRSFALGENTSAEPTYIPTFVFKIDEKSTVPEWMISIWIKVPVLDDGQHPIFELVFSTYSVVFHRLRVDVFNQMISITVKDGNYIRKFFCLSIPCISEPGWYHVKLHFLNSGIFEDGSTVQIRVNNIVIPKSLIQAYSGMDTPAVRWPQSNSSLVNLIWYGGAPDGDAGQTITGCEFLLQEFKLPTMNSLSSQRLGLWQTVSLPLDGRTFGVQHKAGLLEAFQSIINVSNANKTKIDDDVWNFPDMTSSSNFPFSGSALALSDNVSSRILFDQLITSNHMNTVPVSLTIYLGFTPNQQHHFEIRFWDLDYTSDLLVPYGKITVVSSKFGDNSVQFEWTTESKSGTKYVDRMSMNPPISEHDEIQPFQITVTAFHRQDDIRLCIGHLVSNKTWTISTTSVAPVFQGAVNLGVEAKGNAVWLKHFNYHEGSEHSEPWAREAMQDLCGSIDHSSSPTSTLPSTDDPREDGSTGKKSADLIIGLPIGLLLCVIVVVFVVLRFRRRRKRLDNIRNGSSISHDFERMVFSRALALYNTATRKNSEDAVERLRKIICTSKAVRVERTIATNLWFKGTLTTTDIDGTVANRSVVIRSIQSRSLENCAELVARAHLLQSLEHPNLVTLLAVTIVPPPPQLIFECLAGGDLRTYLRKLRMNDSVQVQVDDLIHVCVQVADAMYYLEMSNVVHGRLSTAAILVGSSLADVRVSKLHLTTSDTSISQACDAADARWMSPEVIKSADFSHKGDVWSFGLVAWSIFHLGRNPFQHLSSTQAREALLSDSEAMCTKLVPPEKCPDVIMKWFYRCWAHSPSQRPGFSTLLELYRLVEIPVSVSGPLLQDLELAHAITKSRTLEVLSPVSAHSASKMNSLDRSVTDFPATLHLQRSWFTFLMKLGEGQFGSVSAQVLQRPDFESNLVAVKELHTYQDTDEAVENLRLFRQEALLMMQLDHPNLVKLIGVCFDDDGPPLVVLEYQSGGDLRDWLLKNGQDLPVSGRLSILQQASLGMTELSRLGIVHRDLAARNLMVGPTLTIQVADYGLSRKHRDEKDYYYAHELDFVPLRWLAPEVISSKRFNTLTDIFAFGIVIYEVWANAKQPFADYTNQELIQLFITTSKPLDLVQPLPHPIVQELCSLYAECLSRSPDTRPLFDQIAQRLGQMDHAESQDTTDAHSSISGYLEISGTGQAAPHVDHQGYVSGSMLPDNQVDETSL